MAMIQEDGRNHTAERAAEIWRKFSAAYSADMREHSRAIRPFLDHDAQGETRLVDDGRNSSCVTDAELPMTVREAAKFLGVSRQTLYLWVERKQIPHLRVMGRNIRFLRSDLQAFRAQFKQEVENGTTE